MTDRIRFFEEAGEEIEEQRRWYRKRSVRAEESFLRELDHAVEIVLDKPDRWPLHLEGTRRYVFPRFPFSLIYFVEDDVVVVVAVANENRRPGYWRERLPRRSLR
jgi:plasmid stabilization system protein ParE